MSNKRKDGLFDRVPKSTDSYWNKNALSYGESVMKDDLQEINVNTTKHNPCYVCGHELTWGGDHDVEDHEEYTIVTNLSCPKCGAYTEVYWGEKVNKEEEWNEEETNRRMDIIGQNGNDGLHYDKVEEEEKE